MKLLRRSRDGAPDVVEALRDIGDGLRSGLSLRQALDRTAGKTGSPLAPLAAALASGQPIVPSLRAAAAEHYGDADLSSALCILAVHAETGGDPLPAVSALAERLSRRSSARAEARALTTQARLGSRALLLLTPAFLFLVVATDPRGVVRWLSEPRTRLAVVTGLFLQGLGALWMGAIVATATGERSRIAGIPMLRATRALIAGRVRPRIDEEIADAADTMAFALDAGLAPSAAVATVAPYARGDIGVALRRASSDVGASTHVALGDALSSLDGLAPRRLAAAYESAVNLGVPLAPALRALADDLRERSSITLAEDIRRASVRVLVPLGVLVLPAFVLACLVPLFVGGLEGIAG